MKSLRRTPVGQFVGRMPPMILAIMVTCTVIWLLQLATIRSPSVFWSYLMLAPETFLRGWIWQIVTHQFLHDPLHVGPILLNLFMLWVFGRDLEARWGSWSFLLFFLTCGAGGGLVFVLLALIFHGFFLIGATAAVLGVGTAWALIWPDRQILMFFVIPMRAIHTVFVLLGLELLFAWVPGNGITNFSAIAGMGTAWLYLRWGWRLGSIPRALVQRLDGLRWSLRKRRMKVVDKDWERILREGDDDRRH